MKIRSWLIVDPSADGKKTRIARADRVVIDLTGPVESLAEVSSFCAAWASVDADHPPAFLLQPFSSGMTEPAVALAVEHGAQTLFLSGVRNGAEIQRLDVIVRVYEIRAGRTPGSTAIIALADAAGILAAQSFQHCSKRLKGIGWQLAGDPQSDISCVVQAMIALAASAAGVIAIDGVSPLIDDAAFQSECLTARQNGFAAKLTRQPAQIPIINHIFGDQPPAPAGRTISNTSEPPSA